MPFDKSHNRYKALFWDYNAILEASDKACLYCLTQRDIALILPLLDYVSWATRYNTELGVEPDQELLDDWQGNLARRLMDDCCNDFPYTRYSDEGIYQVSEDGIGWVDRPDLDPRFNAPQVPPLPTPAGSGLRCEAAQNVTGWLRAVADDLIADAGAWSGINALMAALLALVAIALGLTGGGLVVSALLLGLVAALLQTGQGAFDAAMTTGVYDTLQCIVFCNTPNNGEYTEANWQQIKADILSQLTGIAATFLHDQVNAYGLVGLINMSRSGMGSSEGDCDDCTDCPDDAWCYTFDFTAGQQGWSFFESGFGQYTGGVGFTGQAYGTGGGVSRLRRTFDDAQLTSIQVVHSAVGYTAWQKQGVLQFNADPEQNITFLPTNTYNGTNILSQFNQANFTPFDADRIDLYFDGAASSDTTIISVTVRGVGDNPFGEDNCV